MADFYGAYDKPRSGGSGFDAVDWDGYVRSQAFELSAADVALLRRAETNVVGFVMDDESEASAYAALLLRLLANVTGDAACRFYVLRRLETVLVDEPTLLPGRARRIAAASGGEEPATEPEVAEEVDLLSGPAPEAPAPQAAAGAGLMEAAVLDPAALLRCLEGTDAGVVITAARVLALLYSTTAVSMSGSDAFVRWLLSALDGSLRGLEVREVVPVLSVLLRRTAMRLEVGRAGGIQQLCRMLQAVSRDSASSSPTAGTAAQSVPQLLYELCFCLWTLSFLEELQPDFRTTGAIHSLSQTIQSAPVEKVQRMCVATFKNLCCESPEWERSKYFHEMLAAGLMKALTSLKDLKANKWKDPDIEADVDLVLEALAANYEEISTWERYVAEVMSGNLVWGATHEEQFWKENVKCAEEDDFAVLKRLCALLSSADEDVVAIACYDIGEFCRFYPRGREIAKHFGAKDAIMALIDNDNPDLQRHALNSISKIMVTRWENVSA